MTLTRRGFMAAAAMSSASIALNSTGSAQTMHDHMQDHAAHNHPKPERPVVPRLPALIARTANTTSMDAAYETLQQGRDTLDAALQLTQLQEDDANDASTGLGGLPNEDGVVQLDACCLHGPSRRGAAVGSVTGIKNPSRLARAVMERTGYAMLVGQDAQRFAVEQGFSREDLMTERSHQVWDVWKQVRAGSAKPAAAIYDPDWPEPARQAHFLAASQKDLDTLVRQTEPLATQVGIGPQWTWRAAYDALFPAATPLYVSAVNQRHEISSAATTSGVPFRKAGATSDVAVMGAGCYLDPEVGSAGASGNAEANIRIAGAHLIVEAMRRGLSPEEAGMEALQRIVRWYRGDPTALRFVEIIYYVLRKDGAYGSVSLWQGDRTGHVQQFTIHDGVRRSEECRFLFAGNPPNGAAASSHRPA